MKKEHLTFYKGQNNLFNTILFLIFGIILFTNPGGILRFVSYIAGACVTLIGIGNILSYNKTLKKLNIEQNNKLISGIILIILGIILILFSSVIETTIRLICGGWIIYSGTLRLIEALKNKSNPVKIIIAILMILCGFYVALKTNLVFSMIGLFIIIYSVMEIVNNILNQKN